MTRNRPLPRHSGQVIQICSCPVKARYATSPILNFVITNLVERDLHRITSVSRWFLYLPDLDVSIVWMLLAESVNCHFGFIQSIHRAADRCPLVAARRFAGNLRDEEI